MTFLPHPFTRHLPRRLLRRFSLRSSRALSLLLALACGAAPLTDSIAATPKTKEKPNAPKAVKAAKAAKAARAVKPVKPKPAPRAVDYAGEQVNFREWKAVADFEAEMVGKHRFEPEALKT
ncbi:MAG: Lytic murein transglycosylase, partial [Massilia sp.]|nr:Lytic murein transglycosylase [Massilia sp.]